jgi:hypothetical protein
MIRKKEKWFEIEEECARREALREHIIQDAKRNKLISEGKLDRRKVKYDDDEELTYEIIHEWAEEQNNLIAEGIIEKPQIRYGLSPESMDAVRRGRTLEVVVKELNEKYGIK